MVITALMFSMKVGGISGFLAGIRMTELLSEIILGYYETGCGFLINIKVKVATRANIDIIIK